MEHKRTGYVSKYHLDGVFPDNRSKRPVDQPLDGRVQEPADDGPHRQVDQAAKNAGAQLSEVLPQLHFAIFVQAHPGWNSFSSRGRRDRVDLETVRLIDRNARDRPALVRCGIIAAGGAIAARPTV